MSYRKINCYCKIKSTNRNYASEVRFTKNVCSLVSISRGRKTQFSLPPSPCPELDFIARSSVFQKLLWQLFQGVGTLHIELSLISPQMLSNIIQTKADALLAVSRASLFICQLFPKYMQHHELNLAVAQLIQQTFCITFTVQHIIYDYEIYWYHCICDDGNSLDCSIMLHISFIGSCSFLKSNVYLQKIIKTDFYLCNSSFNRSRFPLGKTDPVFL